MKKNILLIFVLSIFGQQALAVRCVEPVQEVILSGENINFKTTINCNWCLIDPSLSTEQKNRQYSMLLTAISTQKEIAFEWGSQVSDCSVKSQKLNGIKPSAMTIFK